MHKFLMIALLPVCLLAACNKEAAEETHDVAWYTAHTDERDRMMEKCKNNPGELRGNPNCVNAQQSAEKQMLDPHNMNTPKF